MPNVADSLSGRAFMGGVPLPTIKLYEYGKAVPETVEPCPLKAPQPSQDHDPVRSMNKFRDVRALRDSGALPERPPHRHSREASERDGEGRRKA